MATATIGNNTGNISGTDDTWLNESAANTNFGSNVVFEIQKYAPGNHGNGLIRFPGLSAIVGPVTVTAATLYLYQSNPGFDITYNVYRMLRDWSESQATWNVYTTGNNWTTPGALDNTTDHSTTVRATPTFNQSAAYQPITSAAFIADVEGMINGTLPNYGWFIERQDAGDDTTYIQVISSEGTDGQRPYMDITYTSAGSSLSRTPVIGTASLLGIAPRNNRGVIVPTMIKQ
jgi:hypothetical protein